MNKNKVLLILFCIFLPICLLLLSYKVVLGLTDLTDNQQQTISFLQDKEELKLNYTSSEVSHLDDVKSVMNFIDYLFYLSLLIITVILTYYKKNNKQLQKMFFYGGITTAVFIFIKLLFSLLAFNFLFTMFHKLFFPQGNWIFPTESLLIQTFSIDFFILISMKIFLWAFIWGLILFIISVWQKKLIR
jgi:uncharacterized membrane protein